MQHETSGGQPYEDVPPIVLDEEPEETYLGSLQPGKCCVPNQCAEDNWKHRAANMRCRTCMMFVKKLPLTPLRIEQACPGRCRRHAPTMLGWPVVFETDWCGDHKLDENKI